MKPILARFASLFNSTSRRALAGSSLFFLVGALAAARIPWTQSRVIGSPEPPAPYRTELAFPNLRFENPVHLVSVPGANLLFLAQQDGRIYSFAGDRNTTATNLVLNLRDHHQPFDALYGITFHPKFRENGFIYLAYVEPGGRTNGSYISRFRVTLEPKPRIDPASEQVILQWLSGGHNGCDIQFGPDGCLYISTGDGSPPDPPDILRTGQRVDDLLSSILRIDVDHAEGGQNYRIPSDNPFVKTPGARGEVWAYGFRNPWRISFGPDRALWVGDVGWELWELVHVVRGGYNAGWSYVEGPNPSVRSDVLPGPTPIHQALVAHPHSEAASITGGLHVRGQKLPALTGSYVYGDWETGKFWSVRNKGDTVTSKIELCDTTLRPVAFSYDPAGDLLILDYNGGIHEFVLNDKAHDPARFPRRLSATGIFIDTAALRPAEGVVEYRINATQWFDYATARRWIAAPGTNVLVPGEKWVYPTNTVVVKTLELDLEAGKPESRRKIETQLLHFDGQTWRGYSYRWNDAQTDAELVPTGGTNSVMHVKDAAFPGGSRQQNWRFASGTECLRCHNPWPGNTLSVTLDQLNTHPLQGGAATEVERFIQIGMLAAPAPGQVLPRIADPYDDSLPAADRARAWLHVNCSACHRFGAGGSVATFLNQEVDAMGTRAIDQKPIRGGFGLASARVIAPGEPSRSTLYYRINTEGPGHMPLIGARFVDPRGVAAVRDWIRSLPEIRPTNSLPLDPDLVIAKQQCAGTDAAIRALRETSNGMKRQTLVQQLTSTASGALALLEVLPGIATPELIATAVASTNSYARDLFERFLPPEQRRHILGPRFDPKNVLSLTGDSGRGKRLFFSDGGPNCSRCHALGGQGRAYGPDLALIARKYKPAEILDHLVNPSKLIAPEFALRIVETRDGLTYSGFAIRETASQLVLRTEDLKEMNFAKSDLSTDVKAATSAMPEGLIDILTAQEAADLISYLRNP